MNQEEDVKNLLKSISCMHVDEFPQECWNAIWKQIKTFSIPDSLSERMALLSHCLIVAAYYLGQLKKDPIIGSRAPESSPADSSDATEKDFVNAMSQMLGVDDVPVPRGLGGLREIVSRRIYILVVSYAIRLAQAKEDIEQLEIRKVIQAVTLWVGYQLQEGL